MTYKKSKNTCYAIKNLNKIVTTWAECKKLTHGQSGMIFKGFETRSEAEAWLNEPMLKSKTPSKKEIKENEQNNLDFEPINDPNELPKMFYTSPTGIIGTITLVGINDPMIVPHRSHRISVDGSFNPKTNVYGAGIAILNESDEITFAEAVSGSNPIFAKSRNVAGEVIGFVRALQVATQHQLESITIICDYEGLYLWTKGDYSLDKSPISRYLKDALITAYSNGLKTIDFLWVNGHRGMDSNETADKLAKRACGIK